MKIYLELVSGPSAKFWEVKVESTEVVTRWGRIGTAGQSKSETSPSVAEARARAEKLAADKQKKGYVVATQGSSPERAGSGPAAKETRAAPSGAQSGAEARKSESDRARLVAFFRRIDEHELIALPPSRSRLTQSAGHEDARGVAHARGIEEPSYLFWHQQSERAFDSDGALIGDLYLHWGGDHGKVARALASLPAPFALIDGGADGAFRIRMPAAASSTAPNAPLRELDVKRRLRDVYEMLDADRATTIDWLRQVVASPLVGLRLEALAILAADDDASESELEAMSVELPAEIAAAKKVDDDTLARRIVAVLGALRRIGSPAYAIARAACQKQKKTVYRAATLELLADEPPSEANEALLRAALLDANLWLRSTAATSLTATLARRDGTDALSVACRLAEDASLAPGARELLLENAGARAGDRHRGFLVIAEDASRPRALRERALDRACEFLQYDAEPEALERVDALLAAGLCVSETAATALAAARQLGAR